MIERAKFERQLNQLRTIILDGLSYYIVWQALDREYQHLLQIPGRRTDFWWRYRGFLAPARKALFFSAVMQLSKAFDTNRRSISVPGLLRATLDNPGPTSPRMLESLKAILDRVYENQDLLARLRRFRNKRLAHFDPSLEDPIDLPSADIHALVDETKSIYNSIKSACGEQPEDFDDMMSNVGLHTSDLVTLLGESTKNG